MPLFVIHRVLDPAMTPDEREMLAIRSIGPIEPTGLTHPTWHRSFVASSGDRFETWCVYTARSKAEVEHWNFACRVPFSDVSEVEQWWASHPGPRPGSLQLLRGRAAPDSGALEATLDSLRLDPERRGVRWLRSFWDPGADAVYSVLMAASIAGAREFAKATGLPHDDADSVDETGPMDFAQYYEIAGRVPHDGDD